MESLVIVGASLAGLSAARAARNLGFTGRLVIIGDDPARPYDRPPLSKDYLLGAVGVADVAWRDPPKTLGSTGASARWRPRSTRRTVDSR